LVKFRELIETDDGNLSRGVLVTICADRWGEYNYHVRQSANSQISTSYGCHLFSFFHLCFTKKIRSDGLFLEIKILITSRYIWCSSGSRNPAIKTMWPLSQAVNKRY